MDPIKILIAGDFCVREAAVSMLYKEKIEELSEEIRVLSKEHDISIVNVETVLSETGEPIIKSGPNLKSPLASLDLLKRFGFTVAACANNHMGDYGNAALLETLQNLKNTGFTTVGAGANQEEAERPCYIRQKNCTVAIVNCAEHEFGIARGQSPGRAGMDVYRTAECVKKAREEADAVIVYLHGGNEHNPLPRPGMKKFCRHLAESGASAVIVAHSHCPQGIEEYRGVPIAYGLGNFYMAGKDSGMWGSGYLASLTIAEDGKASLMPIPYRMGCDGSYLRILQGEEKERFGHYLKCISALLNDPQRYPKYWLAWCDLYRQVMPESYDLTKEPADWGVLFLRNSYSCESHNELMTSYFTAYCNGELEGLEEYKESIHKLQAGIIEGIK